MTREEIEALPAGPELDRLIAEAMGRRWYITREGKYMLLDPLAGDPMSEIGVQRATAPPDTEARERWKVSKFSTEIAAAWQVVEWISRPERCVNMVSTRFAYWWDQEHLWASSAEEAALAICRAALLALARAELEGG